MNLIAAHPVDYSQYEFPYSDDQPLDLSLPKKRKSPDPEDPSTSVMDKVNGVSFHISIIHWYTKINQLLTTKINDSDKHIAIPINRCQTIVEYTLITMSDTLDYSLPLHLLIFIIL